MKCEKCEAEFTLKEQARANGCCPSCGETIPVSEYSPGVPDRRWWRLFRGAPLGLKLWVLLLVLISCFTVLNFLLAVFPIMMAEGRGALVQGIAIYVVVLLMLFHMLKAVVRGSVPYLCIMALAALGWAVADSFRESLVVFLPLTIFLLSFLTPASRRWGRKIREEDLAYWIAARSGAFPFRRMVAKCIFKWSAIAVLLFVSVGMCCCSSKSLEAVVRVVWG